MKTFTISTDLNITAYESRNRALGTCEATGEKAFADANELGEQLTSMNVKLVDLWNSLPGVTPVKKFMNREAGLKRIFAQLQSLVAVPAAELEEFYPKGTPQERKAKKDAKHPPAVIRETLEAFVDETAKKLKKGKAAKRESVEVVVADIKAKAAKKADRDARVATKPSATAGPREGTKEALVIGLLKRKGGVTRAEIVAATGWLEHSCGGFMSGTAKTKLGLPVESYKTEDGQRAYRLTGGPA
jgi:uncharacterized protein DUF3489